MASASYNKAPPLLSSSKSYNDWKKLIELWTDLTTLAKNKQGPALVLSLEGKAQEAALELDSASIAHDDGVRLIIDRLDKIYEKDKLTEKYNAIEKFETYRRPKSMSIRDFLVEFDKRLYKTQSYKTTMSEDLKAYRLLKAANLDPTHEQLVKATVSDLIYSEVRTKLIKIFSDESSTLTSEFNSLKIKEETTMYSRDRHHESTDEDKSFSDEDENTFYAKKSYSKSRGRSDSRRIRMKNSVRRDNADSSNWRRKEPSTRSSHNPVDRNGRVTKCAICESIFHWQQDCPEKHNQGSETYIVHEIVMHHNEQSNPEQLKCLVAETWNCGLLDCGASKTVCGEKWLSEYVGSLSSEEQSKVRYFNSKSIYRFGDGKQIQAVGGARIPAHIGTTTVEINTDIVAKELPLLLSKSFMKRANMVINFQSDVASAFGENVDLTTTTSGHYTIPLTQPKQLMCQIDKPNHKIVLIARNEQSNAELAKRLQRQFAHPMLTNYSNLYQKLDLSGILMKN